MANYTTRQGDMLDAICHQYYGNISGAIETVLDVNPSLCEQPLVLSAGLVIELPVIQSAVEPTDIDLFD